MTKCDDSNTIFIQLKNIVIKLDQITGHALNFRTKMDLKQFWMTCFPTIQSTLFWMANFCSDIFMWY